jgi:stress response protein YsnF
MTKTLKVLATLALTAALAPGFAQTTASSPSTPKRVHRKPVPKGPTVQQQIEELRQQEQADHGQIDNLKQQLSDRDAQLQAAQQAAQQAQAAAQAAQQAAQQQQQTLSATSESVSSLQNSVSDLKANNVSLASTIQTNQAEVKKAIETPEAVHYKGITISPAGSFLAAETVWRQGATGGGLNTGPTLIPLANSDDAQLSEFYGTGRQSRIAIRATGKLSNVALTGYYEMDWLGAGITSNSNQSNSYVLRQRQLWADALFTNGWDVSGGQGWSLVTETTQGETRGTEILPATIDPQYEAGFIWTRQYSFRVTKNFANKFWIGASAENPETLNPGGSNLPFNVLIGSDGQGGGLYNNTANYSFNYSPDFVGKLVFQPGWGHWEIFGIERNFRDRIYPNLTCTSSTACTGTTAGAYNDTSPGAGIGGGFRVPLGTKKFTVGLKGLYGKGMGRYGDSTLGDVTIRPTGVLDPLKGFSAISTVELNPTKRLMLYLNYGGDYLYRDYWGKVGYGSPLTSMTGCDTEPSPTNQPTSGFGGGTGFGPGTPASCGNQNKDTQEFTGGEWYDFYNGPKGRMRFGLQYSRWERDIWSGAGGTTNPGGGARGADNMFWTSFRYYVP